MCGRTSVSEASLIATARLAERSRESVPPNAARPSNNFGPGNVACLVASTEKGGRTLVEARWGLLPSWQVKRGDKPNYFAMFNAKSESIFDLPSFKNLITNKLCRCVVAVDGFYEWSQQVKKQPYFVSLNNEISYVAALSTRHNQLHQFHWQNRQC